MASPRLPLSSRPWFLPDEISRREFATVFRGYDPAEVRTFLNQLAEQSSEAADRVAEIQRALAESDERAKNPELDEEMVTKLLGEQTAQILRSAREAAQDIRTKAEEEVSRSLREAHEVTSKMREEAEALLVQRTAEAERRAQEVRTEASADAESMRSEAQEEAAAIRNRVADEVARLRAETEAEMLQLRQRTQSDLVDERSAARQQARDMVDTARAEAKALVERTQDKQAELIEGLIRKRKIALAQVEELRAGRQRLLKAYKMVRGTLDEITAELERVEGEARSAAEIAGTRAAQSSDIPQEELDSVIEMEQFVLDDDVSTEVIDLIEGSNEHDSESTETGTSGTSLYPGERGDAAESSGGEVIDVADVQEVDGTNTGQGSPSGQSTGSGTGNTATMERERQTELLDMQVDAENLDEEAEEELRATSSAFIIGEPFNSHDSGEMDEAVKARRDAVVGRERSQTVRKLKRTLQDEQEAIVARLRTSDIENEEELLGSVDDQIASYQRSVVKLFREVVRVGANSVTGGSSPDKSVLDRTGTEAARGLAQELVQDLRGQLEPVIREILSGGEIPDISELQHRLAGPYRAVRGDYLEQLAEDRIGGAFDQGVAFAR